MRPGRARFLAGTWIATGTAASMHGADAAAVPADAASSGLQLIDWCVIVLYAVVVLWIGWRASRKQGSTSDYFLGARGFGSFAIGISMFVTLFSAVSYLSGPGEVIRYGPGIFWGMVVSAIIVYPILAYWILPVLTRRRVLSLYELLGERLGPRVRLLGAGMFMLYRTVWMGTLMYFAATALSVMLGVGPGAVPIITVVAGFVAIVYTTMGGLRAVMLTDLLQFFILFIGVVVTVVIITMRFEGLDWFPREWSPHWPAQPVFSWDLTIRVTLFGAALQWIVTDVAHGVDQTQVQRYIASADLPRARRAVLTRVLGSVFVWTFLVLLGFALMSFYQRFSASLPAGETLTSYADKLFPYFIAHELPVGLAGLVVAGIFAAAMSSVDSGVNSITAVVLNDFLPRHEGRSRAEATDSRFAMVLAGGVGIFVIVVSLFIASVPGNFYEVTNRTFRLFIPLELGLVVLAMFVRSATSFGVIWGVIYGFTFGVLLSYWEKFTGMEGISVTLYVPSILIVQLIVSRLVSMIPVRREDRSRALLVGTLLAVPLVIAVGVAIAMGNGAP